MLKQINESFKKYSRKYNLHEEFAYKTKHGLGPGMLPRDVRVVDWEEPNDYDTIIYVDRELTPQEMSDYELSECTDAKECLDEAYNVREFSDMLYDMIENDEIDPKKIAEDLIYWCSEDDIKRYMEVNDIIDIDDYEE